MIKSVQACRKGRQSRRCPQSRRPLPWRLACLDLPRWQHQTPSHESLDSQIAYGSSRGTSRGQGWMWQPHSRAGAQRLQ